MKKHLVFRRSFLHVFTLCTLALILGSGCTRALDGDDNGNYNLADAQARINEIASHLECDVDEHCQATTYMYPDCAWSDLYYSTKFASIDEVNEAILDLVHSQERTFKCPLIAPAFSFVGTCQANVCTFTGGNILY